MSNTWGGGRVDRSTVLTSLSYSTYFFPISTSFTVLLWNFSNIQKSGRNMTMSTHVPPLRFFHVHFTQLCTHPAFCHHSVLMNSMRRERCLMGVVMTHYSVPLTQLMFVTMLGDHCCTESPSYRRGNWGIGRKRSAQYHTTGESENW